MRELIEQLPTACMREALSRSFESARRGAGSALRRTRMLPLQLAEFARHRESLVVRVRWGGAARRKTSLVARVPRGLWLVGRRRRRVGWLDGQRRLDGLGWQRRLHEQRWL